MQGIAMHLQNRYQRQRLRTRIALGKVGLVLIQVVEIMGMPQSIPEPKL
jgi:hypothetical protein